MLKRLSISFITGCFGMGRLMREGWGGPFWRGIRNLCLGGGGILFRSVPLFARRAVEPMPREWVLEDLPCLWCSPLDGNGAWCVALGVARVGIGGGWELFHESRGFGFRSGVSAIVDAPYRSPFTRDGLYARWREPTRRVA